MSNNFNQENIYERTMCAHPKTAVAARMCCGLFASTDASLHFNPEYHGELVTSSTNEDTCIAAGGYVCDPETVSVHDNLFFNAVSFDDHKPDRNVFYWTNSTCATSVIVTKSTWQ